MIALLLLVAAEVSARVDVVPPRAQVGEPVVVTLVVERPASTAVELPKIEPGVVGSWMFLESLGVRRDPPRADGVVVETTSWSAFALEGDAKAPALAVQFLADGAQQELVATAGAVAVARALAEGEDAARPAKGFRPPVEWRGGGSRLVLAGVVLAALAVALVAAWILRRRRARRVADTGPRVSALEQIARIAAEPRDSASANRDVLYAVTRIVRSSVDAHVGELRAARTDAEWLTLVAADARVPEGARSASKRLLERAERVKYAGESPTRFATDEALADARAIVEALEPAQVAA